MPPNISKMGGLKPFQLLEITIISAQDLEYVSKKMRTYAVAWVHPTRKLTTGVDSEGGNNPTWNDKLVFRVDENFLRQDNSALQIEIYSDHWFRDSLVGGVRVLLGNLIPPTTRLHPNHRNRGPGMRFFALQIRRPSGRPQGILNIGVTLLDGSMRSMPLYTLIGYRDLIEKEQPPRHNENTHYEKSNISDNTNNNVTTTKPILRRTKSERSERVTFDDGSMAANSSLVAIPSNTKDIDKEGSIISMSFEPPPQMMLKKKGKASSVINGAELREKPKINGKKGKSGSVLSDSIVSKESSAYNKPNEDKPNRPKLKLIELDLGIKDKPTNETKPAHEPPSTEPVDVKTVTESKSLGVGDKPDKPKDLTKLVGKPIVKYNGNGYGGPKGAGNNGKFVFGGPNKGKSMLSDFDVGPSASEVAATMAQRRYPLEEEESSVMDGWSLDESVEGLKSKLQRWRTEVPPLYDRRITPSSNRSTGRHSRRHSDGSSGLFSCFSNIYGYECQCICGKPQKKRSTRHRSPSVASSSWL